MTGIIIIRNGISIISFEINGRLIISYISVQRLFANSVIMCKYTLLNMCIKMYTGYMYHIYHEKFDDHTKRESGSFYKNFQERFC